MVSKRNLNIVRLLVQRESGWGHKAFFNTFHQTALELAEHGILQRLQKEDLCRSLDDLSNETESVFNIEQSRNGHYAATVQTNKSVNIFQVSTMNKIAEYHTNERSVWTLAFHPVNCNIIAFGTLGGKVFVYVDGQKAAWLEEHAPIGSLCFHPVDHYLVLTSGNEVTFWDWQNDTVMNTGTYNDCKCRFLHITTSSILITGISQTTLFASAGIGKNLATVEPQYMMASFLRTINFMLDSLERGCTIGNSFDSELRKQFYVWNHLLKIIANKRDEPHCFYTVAPEAKCMKSYLNTTLVVLNRRIDDILENLERCKMHKWLSFTTRCVSDNIIDKHCHEPMMYFERICSNYVEQRYSGYIRYIFDLTLVKNILHKIFKLYLNFGYQTSLLEPWQESDVPMDSSIISHDAETKNQFLLQAWDLGCHRDASDLPDFKEDWKNVISICSINNDSNVSISQCELFIASVRIKAVKELEVRSLDRANFGECMFIFRFVVNFVSLSFSPSGRYLVVGLRCKKRLKFAYILDKDSKWKIGVNFCLDPNSTESQDSAASSSNELVGLRLCLPKESFNYKEINCIKWAALPGYGLLIGLKSKFMQVCR
ncbi:activating molecule in BECN1-regulated autophagy protein 1-like [Sabethes cyaneus]|uniref:activating molecule in BECN1-regulated autophagy protein 1-like n=1 Tax=Sabethes cyaneus TaxID=53552 RepID=UPI00237D354E|nr:activating molecule in BECN1-regulated autophagy protein 1-like [Sabethes cyaneus]